MWPLIELELQHSIVSMLEGRIIPRAKLPSIDLGFAERAFPKINRCANMIGQAGATLMR